MKNLIQDLKTKDFKHFYLLFGEEEYLKRQYKKKLKEALLPGEDTVNLNCYEGKNILVRDLVDQAETMPFFADRRLLLVEESGFFKNASEELAAYLPQMPDTSYMVFVESEVDKRGKLYKAVNKIGRAVEFSAQNEATLTKWILSRLKREEKNITRSAMDLFLEKTGTDMDNITMELEKLLSFTQDQDVITPEDVEAICTGQVANKIFEMISAAASGDQKKAFSLYADLLALKEPPMRILILLGRQYNQLLQVKEMRGLGYDVPATASKMGVKPFVVQKCLRGAGRVSAKRLRDMVGMCAELNESITTGNMNDKLAVELLLVEGCRKGTEEIP